MVQVHVIVGSPSDLHFVWDSQLPEILSDNNITYSVSACSAHRNADALQRFIKNTCQTTVTYICGAGWAAALPGAVKAIVLTRKYMEVLGVAFPSEGFPNAEDARFGITRLPPGVDVELCGVGTGGLNFAADRACTLVNNPLDPTDAANRFSADVARIKPPQFNCQPPEVVNP